MANSFIQVPVDAGGKKVDATQVVVGVNTVERQHIRPAGNLAADIGNVTASEGVSASLSVTSANRTHATSASLAAWVLFADVADELRSRYERVYSLRGEYAWYRNSEPTSIPTHYGSA